MTVSTRPMRVRWKKQRNKTTEPFELDGAAGQIELLRDHHLGVTNEHQRLVDERPQHQALDTERQQEHDHDGKAERNKGGHAVLVEADQRERGEQDPIPWAKLNTPDALKIRTKPNA